MVPSSNPLSKYANLTEVQIRGMITHAAREYPFLDHSSEDTLCTLARLMISVDFVSDQRVTPLRSSLLFLRRIGQTANPPIDTIRERDFVFLIKMFGLIVRDKHGLLEFLPDNVWIDESELGESKPATETKITDDVSARAVEMEISDIKRHRKIHERRIDAGTNRLLRWYRDGQLALVLAERVKAGEKIGEAREHLRSQHDVKDHEYVRVRKRAFDMGLIESARTSRRKNIRVTLDPDCAAYIETRIREDRQLRGRTPAQAVNGCLRDLYSLTNNGRPMPAAQRVVVDDDDLDADLKAVPATAAQPKEATAPARKAASQPTASAKAKPVAPVAKKTTSVKRGTKRG